MPELLLDENHIYHLDGRQIDGLTSTLAEAGLMGNFGTEWHLTKGTAVHLATELWDKGTLDESTVDPQIAGYLESWKRFRDEQNYIPTHIEFKVVNPILQVATTIDRLPGPYDLKSGAPEPWHILQVAFQWATLWGGGDMIEFITSPMDIYLDQEGKSPKVKTYKYPELKEAYKVYCSMLFFLRWRRERYGNSTTNHQP
jgi:hypothetical protein